MQEAPAAGSEFAAVEQADDMFSIDSGKTASIRIEYNRGKNGPAAFTELQDKFIN